MELLQAFRCKSYDKAFSTRMQVARWVRSALWGLLAVVIATNAQAEISASISAGAGGKIRANTFTPVQVVITNPDNDVDGTLRAVFMNGNRSETAAEAPITLPQNSRKSVFLYVPPVSAPLDEINLTLVDQNRNVVWQQRERLDQLSSGIPVIGGIGQFPNNFPPAEPEKSPRAYYPLLFSVEHLPDRWEGLQMYDMLVAHPPLDTSPERSQVDALRDWIMRGGVLAVDLSEPTDAYANGPLANLLPFVPTGIDTITVAELELEKPVARFVDPTGKVLLQTGDIPLIVQRPIGLGCVIGFALSPGDVDFGKWLHKEQLWENVFAGVIVQPPESTLDFRTEQPGSVIETASALVVAEENGAVRLGAVFLLIALYALAIGPGDRLLVKRLGKPHLTWVTYPTMVLVFTFAAWFGAEYFVGGDMSSDATQRVLIVPSEKQALDFTITSLFVPRTDEYRLSFQTAALITQLRPAFSADEIQTLDHESNVLRFIIPSWQQRVFLGSTTIDAYPDISVETHEDGDKKTLTITNSTDELLVSGRVFYRDKQYVVNTIQANSTSEIVLDRGIRLDRKSGLNAYSTIGDPQKVNDWTPIFREFCSDGALMRGALLLSFVTDATLDPLVVNEEIRSVKAKRNIDIIVYPNFTEPAGEAQQ